MAVFGNRCCGGEWIGCTCRPSFRGARVSTARRRVGTLTVVIVLMLAAHVATGQAQDAPQPPVIPAMPTVSVQVSVSIPAVSISVQAGTLDVSVSTAPVDVSVSVSSQNISAKADATRPAPQQPTEPVGSSTCCDGESKQVAPPVTSVKTKPAPRAVMPAPRPRPTVRAAAKAVRARTTRSPRADSSARVPAAKQISRRASTPLPTRPRARRGCCDDAPAGVGAAAVKRLAHPPRAGPSPDRNERTQVLAAALPEEGMRDNRLLLQLGVLGAFLYLVCLAGWFSATKLRRNRA